jgi:hypothetical protein
MDPVLIVQAIPVGGGSESRAGWRQPRLELALVMMRLGV